MADEPALTPAAGLADSRLRVGFATSPGQVRSTNEDSVLCEPIEAASVRRRGLFCAVADGMGGHAGGDVASALAVRTARDVYYTANVTSAEEALRLALESANQEVFAAGVGKSGREQMGSTITAVSVHDDRVFIGHVGDSRCYLVQDGQIRQLTRDHSWVADEVRAGLLTAEEARSHPRRNIITRALGLQQHVEVDLVEAPVALHWTLLLCSDGLHGVVSDEEMLAHANRLAPQQAVDELVALANARGGPDNISVVLVEMAGDSASGPSSEREPQTARTRRPAAPTESAPPAHPQDYADTGPDPATATLRTSEATRQTAPADARPDPPISRRSNRGKGMLIGILIGLAVMASAIGWLVWSAPARPTAPDGPLLPPPPPATASPSALGRFNAIRATRPSVVPPPVLALRRAPERQAGDPDGEGSELQVLIDAAVRVAPVLGAPVVGWFEQGESITAEAEVYGEEADGSARWYLVTHPGSPEPTRGFIHSTLVRRSTLIRQES